MNGMLKLIVAATVVLAAVFALSSDAQAELYQVNIVDFSFAPNNLTINVGDMVEWTNQDGVSHTSTSDDGVWDSGLLGQGDTFTYTFTLAGSYSYHCTPHPFMTGTVVVSAATGIEDQSSSIPGKFEISQNYPNPFNARTSISYVIPSESRVTIEIFDLLGRRVETLVDRDETAGTHFVIWDAENASSGLYFYRIKADDIEITKMMSLIK